MSTSQDPDRAAELRSLLRSSPSPVRYDVERGLERHQRLVAAGTPVPDWASELPLPGRVRRFGKPAWWLAGALTMVGAVWLSLPSNSRPRAGSTAAPIDPAKHATHATPKQDTAPTRVAPRAASKPAVQAIGGRPDAPRAREPLDDVSPGLHDSPALHVAAQGGHAGTPSADPTEEPRLENIPTASERAAGTETSPQDTLSGPERDPVTAPAPRREGVARTSDLATQPGVKAHSRVSAQSPRDAEEMRQLTQAEQLLAPEPVRALRIVREGHVRFRGGYFAQERRYIELMALFALGRAGEAHAHAVWFLQDYPTGPYRHRVELEVLRHPSR